MKDLELKKIDHKEKYDEDNAQTTDQYKATLRDEHGEAKLTIKKASRQGLENILGTDKPGETVQMKLTNTQTTLDEHAEDSED